MVLAQSLRFLQDTIKNDPWLPAPGQWVQKLIDLNIRLCEIVQREAYLVKQCAESEDLLKDTKKSQQQLDEWHAEMEALNQDYWSVERMLYANDALCPTGPLWRAYLAARKVPQWHLFAWLNEDCVRRGGCCGRACGCCKKPRSSLQSKGDGHCTRMCGCCMESRGFSLNEEQQKLCQPTVNVMCERHVIDEYSRCMMEAYTYGVVVSGKLMSENVTQN